MAKSSGKKEDAKKNTSGKKTSGSKKIATQSISKLKETIREKEENIRDWEDKYTRLFAEFDNYRKRTIKEKADLINSASEKVIIELLPVLDDFERAINVLGDTSSDAEGILLIYNKLRKVVEKEGLKEIEALNKELDTDFHEAITQIPAPNEKQKGKIIDVVEKGYFLKDKIIRFAKVVVGQ